MKLFLEASSRAEKINATATTAPTRSWTLILKWFYLSADQ